MAKKITDKVTWVGKIDWELVHFHGHELSTYKGSSYNSYLVQDKIDYVIMNHNEIDHSGALPALMREIPDVPIYCTQKGESIIRGHYHQDWNFVNVKTGDTLDLGDSKLVFIEAPMLHWPDTMFTYMTGENILFSNDGFGQHFASEELYNDKVDVHEHEMYSEAMKYYVNILNPYSPMVTRKIKEILAMNVPVDMICPSHGIIWRDNPMQIVETYQKWAANYQENQITGRLTRTWSSS